MSSYKRAYELIFSARDGTELTFSQTGERIGLMITFDINKTKTPANNQATISISNPSRDTIATLQSEGIITLKAGYDGDIATILVGEKQSMVYEDDGATKRIILKVIEGEGTFKQVLISRNYSFGATLVQVVNDVAAHLVENVPSIIGFNTFALIDFTIYQFPKVVDGNAFEILTDLLDPIGYEFFINKGIISVILKNSSLTDLIVELNPGNGMIGSPKPISESDTEKNSLNGLECRSILNYNFDVGRLLRVTSNDLPFGNIYRMDSVTFTGNSFEGEWVANIRAYEIEF